MDESTCFVYLISCSSGSQVFVKIGRSKSIYRRISNLQTGCPHPIAYIFVISSAYEEEVDGLERLLHRLLRDDRLRGEWYEGTHRFFGNLNSVLSRVNRGGFTYEEIQALPDMNAGPELEIMMHRHDFSFQRVILDGATGAKGLLNATEVDASAIAALLLTSIERQGALEPGR